MKSNFFAQPPHASETKLGSSPTAAPQSLLDELDLNPLELPPASRTERFKLENVQKNPPEIFFKKNKKTAARKKTTEKKRNPLKVNPPIMHTLEEAKGPKKP